MKTAGATAGVDIDVHARRQARGPAAASSFRLLPDDPRLPSRDRLLDETLAAEMFADRLSERGRLTIERVERLRAKYRVGESLRTVHRVWVAGRSYLVSARMRATGAAALFAEARRDERACPPARGVWHEPDMKTVFWTFPNDRCLRNLDAIARPLPVVHTLYPGAPSVAVVGYNPERAAIARIATAHGPAAGFVKLYADSGFEPARRALLWLEDAIAVAGSPLRVPRLRVGDDRRRLLIVDAVAGAHLDAVPGDQLVPVFTALGTSLARLHALPTSGPPGLPGFGAFDDHELTQAVAVVGWARPRLGDLAQRTLDLLTAHRPPVHERVCVHGDMNARNFLWAADADVGLIDFDQASLGPAAADVAGVLAWLRTRALTGEWTCEREVELAAALRRGYEQIRSMPPERELRWFLAAALLVERAQRSVTRIRHDQLACLEPLLTAAHATAAEVIHG